jgi:hypothetical protein
MPRNTRNSQATDLDIDRDVQETPTQSRQGTPTGFQNENDDDNNNAPDLQDQTNASLAQAIMLMTAELRRRDAPPKPTGSKVKEPDTFDGSDPKKLNNFILLCNLYFRNNSAYSDDTTKVTFALTHLRGTALEFFEPMLTSDDQLDWEDDWQEFIRVLRTQFGPIDPTADAEDNIDNLKMKDNQRILKYNVEFNRLAVQTGWNDSVLRHRYYSGLAERIKDVMGQQGKPSTLENMKTIAHSIDSRHWERIREKSRSGSDKTNTTPGNKSDKKPNSTNNSNNSNNNNSNRNQSKGSGSGSGSGNSNNNNNNKNDKSKPTTNPLTDKLGKDGKLTPQERQRRFDNNLCMFCGGAGHTANNCSKSTSSASKSKARAATTDASQKEEPKK